MAIKFLSQTIFSKDLKEVRLTTIVLMILTFIGIAFAPAKINSISIHFDFATWTNFPWIWQVIELLAMSLLGLAFVPAEWLEDSSKIQRFRAQVFLSLTISLIFTALGIFLGNTILVASC